MRKILFVLLCLFLYFTAGCHSGPSQSQIRRQKKEAMKQYQEMMKMMQPQMEMMIELVKEYEDIGVAAVKVMPANAKLYIDGGEYIESKDEITLPVGPHSFKAIWPDGSELARDIYVVTALTDVNFKFDLNNTSRSMDIKWHTEKPEFHKTSVVLKKPAS